MSIAMGTGLTTATEAAAATGRPAVPARGNTGAYLLPDHEHGFIRSGEVFHTDWADGTTRQLTVRFPVISGGG